MSALFFKRFLQRPFQVASIIPSSKALVERVSDKIDFRHARVIAEYGPGEGVHTREIVRRMRAGCATADVRTRRGFLARSQRQFANDPRVHVINGTRPRLPEELERARYRPCDYILSGIPFSILKIDKKRALLQKTHDALARGGSFIIYQVTNELKQHATHLRPRGVGIFPAKYSADVHHRFPQDDRPQRACSSGAARFAPMSLQHRHAHDPGADADRKRIRWARCPSRQSALYGASTQRAVLNFPVSGYRFSRPFIRALGLIKWSAAQANHDLGLLDAEAQRLDRAGGGGSDRRKAG